MLDVAGLDVAASAYPALALGTSAVLLLVGSLWGRPGGLVALGLVAALATAATTAVSEIDAGRVDRTPQSAAELRDSYSIGAGEIVIDLREIDDLDALDGRTLDLEAHVGHIEVIVPRRGLDVEAATTIDGGGESVLFGDRVDGAGDGEPRRRRGRPHPDHRGHPRVRPGRHPHRAEPAMTETQILTGEAPGSGPRRRGTR